jgi:hypothetical protein
LQLPLSKLPIRHEHNHNYNYNHEHNYKK